ncbi:MAG: HlyD family efflux transporter periplasmic adaptor subunit, partial [Isosphaeraceae bacterium]
PLRGRSTASTSTQTRTSMDSMMGGMGGGGRGGRGGGGGGGMMGMMEKPGSTRIISIMPEGTKVKTGDIVCELDSSAFRTELQAQQIRHAEAKARVEQVQAILDVNEITFKEYRDGIFPQDLQLVRQYVQACKTDEDRARKNYDWGVETAKKGIRSAAQVQADQLALQQAQFALREAEGMSHRLETYTAPKILKNLQAKLEAIKSDKLAQESSFQLESDRLKRLEQMVANCTLKAPRDGIVVYANQQNMWGRTEARIDEGVTVREGQPIVEIPDPKNMRVRAKINESKISSIYTGQRAEVRIDAFPDRPLRGTVAEVTAIPAPANGPVSDVRIYYATVNIDSGGFESLRPGLSAEVTFLVDNNPKVTRVPIQAIRWVNNQPFAAIPGTTPNADGSPSWQWRSVRIGKTSPVYAEVIEGLKPGERVVAKPELLAPAPTLKQETKTQTVAGNESRPRG